MDMKYAGRDREMAKRGTLSQRPLVEFTTNFLCGSVHVCCVFTDATLRVTPLGT